LKKLIHIVGNRPQFVKLAVLHAVIQYVDGIEQEIIHTGQHFSNNMSDIFFNELKIPQPKINLNIQEPSTNLFIAKASDALQSYFETQKEALVLVYGDTNTTLAAAIAAKRAGLKLLHFEAGVRTADTAMPEEINRQLTDRLADVNYCCTTINQATLFNEGYNKAINSSVVLTGDLMLDAFVKIKAAPENVTASKNYVACTIHRAASITDKHYLAFIVEKLNQIHKNIEVIMPMHPNTAKHISQFKITTKFTILQPLGYPSMKTFLTESSYVITDSGGTSREAFFAKKKSLIIMEYPFWPEIIDANCAINTSFKSNNFEASFEKLIGLESNFNDTIFGDGNAALKIKNHLLSIL
jgi:UDP-GlcNAc3NAcA epimerase